MRVHLCAAFYVLMFMQFYDLTPGEKAAVILTIALVIAMEALNTAVEACVDMISPDYSRLAEKAKDAAAGAVLTAALAAVGVAAAVFWDTAVFADIFRFFSDNIAAFVALIVSAVAWFWFIFAVKYDDKNKKDK